MKLRLGTRGSPLARWQAEWVAARLVAGGHRVELVPIATHGDATQPGAVGETTVPVANLGGVGVFTKELQRALLDERIDLAVHSLKDLPTDIVPGLAIAAVPERESPFDVIISRQKQLLSELPAGAVVGTGSLRRRAQILHVRPDLQMADIRGNIDTRLRKLLDGEFDAIVLAEAGLKRLGLIAHATAVLPWEIMLPAVGQGALGIEARSDDAAVREALATLDHAATHYAVIAERTLLAELRGGCLAPVGASARAGEQGEFLLSATVVSVDGRQRILAEASSDRDPADLGRHVAHQLLLQGAAELIASSRSDSK